MGTGGYSTDQEYLAYISEGRRYHPDVVLLFFYYNDLLYNISASYDGYPKPIFRVDNGNLRLSNVPVPRVGRLGELRTRLRSVAVLQLLKKAVPERPRNQASPIDEIGVFSPTPRPWVAAAWSVTEELVVALRDAVRQDGGRLIVAYVPAAFEVPCQKRSRDVAEELGCGVVSARLARLCLAKGMEFADLREALGRSTADEPSYYPIDGHWTPQGHSRVAEWLSDLLLSRQ